jgi:hypothetical protein
MQHGQDVNLALYMCMYHTVSMLLRFFPCRAKSSEENPVMIPADSGGWKKQILQCKTLYPQKKKTQCL